MLRYFSGIYVILIILFSSNYSFGQGARSASLGNANVLLQDESSILNNPAGMGTLKSVSSIFSYHNRFGLASLSTLEAGCSLPFKGGVVGVSIRRYGNELYNESAAGVAFSHQINNVSLGAKASYQQLHIKEYGTKGVVVLELGGIAQVIPKLFFAAHIFNLNQAAYAKEKERVAPVAMKAGLGYKPNDKLLLLAEIQKNLTFKPQVKFGIEYFIIPRLSLRTAIAANPVNNSFGFGFVLKKFKIDYALSSFQRLGFQHTVSLTTLFLERKEI